MTAVSAPAQGRAVAVMATCLFGCTLIHPATLGAQNDASLPKTAREDTRGEEQTFLTFPEWYLVYAPAEFARHLRRDGAASRFPYLGQVLQYWQAYGAVNRRVERRYPPNTEYQVMLWVIGVSTTVEYAIREAYERWVGRPFEHTRRNGPTAEERLAARVAQDYVDVILDRPWYEYDFVGALRTLWRDTPCFGPDVLRKWERRYALTSEWAAKALYAKLIKFANEASNEVPSPRTVVLLSGVSSDAGKAIPNATVLREAGGQLLVSVPRYAAFRSTAAAVATLGGRFEEIAGNRNAVAVSALVRPNWQPARGRTRVLLRQSLYTEPQHERVLFETPVHALAALLREQSETDFTLEHVFDY